MSLNRVTNSIPSVAGLPAALQKLRTRAVSSRGRIAQGTTTISALNGVNSIVGASTPAVTFGTTDIITENVSGAQVVLQNFNCGTGNVDTPNTVGTPIDAGLEISIDGSTFTSSIIMGLTFGGQSTFTFPANYCSYVISDPIPFELLQGTLVRVCLNVTPITQTDAFQRTNASASSGGPLDTINVGDVSKSGTRNTAGGVGIYSHFAIIGNAALPSYPAVGIVGDSIAQGTGDTPSYAGWVWRWLSNNSGNAMSAGGNALIKAAMSGTALSQWNNAVGASPNRSMKYTLNFMRYIDTFIMQLGANDFATKTVANMEAWAVSLCQAAKAAGAQTCIISTLLPVTFSTDSWATNANQFPAGANITGTATYSGGTATECTYGGTNAKAVVVSGDQIVISNSSNNSVLPNGTYTATYIDATHFSIPVAWGGSSQTATMADSTQEARRQAYNTWVRTQAVSPSNYIDAYIDPCLYVEVAAGASNSSFVNTLNGGYFRTDDGAPSADGTNPSPTLHAAIATGLQPQLPLLTLNWQP